MNVSLFLFSIVGFTASIPFTFSQNLFRPIPAAPYTKPTASQHYPVKAVTVIRSYGGVSGGRGPTNGLIIFTQNAPNAPVTISGKISGLSPGLHGFHVHQFGNLSQGCGSMGGHFNPDDHTHGGPTFYYRHSGDLGNIEAGSDGEATIYIIDSRISLLGRTGVVVHEDEDDLGKGGDEGSLKTGNAGARVGCGVIGLSNEVPHFSAPVPKSRFKVYSALLSASPRPIIPPAIVDRPASIDNNNNLGRYNQQQALALAYQSVCFVWNAFHFQQHLFSAVFQLSSDPHGFGLSNFRLIAFQRRRALVQRWQQQQQSQQRFNPNNYFNNNYQQPQPRQQQLLLQRYWRQQPQQQQQQQQRNLFGGQQEQQLLRPQIRNSNNNNNPFFRSFVAASSPFTAAGQQLQQTPQQVGGVGQPISSSFLVQGRQAAISSSKVASS